MVQVHPDGVHGPNSGPGSAGCIVPRTQDEAEEVRHCLMNINESGLKSMNITFNYP